jgi:probable O-glycosylation ligase (exosortase A-associated)
MDPPSPHVARGSPDRDRGRGKLFAGGTRLKQLVFMVALTLIGTLGVYVISPFMGVFIYYLFAVLRPQYMWKWSLPEGITWSYFVALATMGAAFLGLLGVMDLRRKQLGQESSSHRLGLAHVAMLLFVIWIGVTFVTARSIETAYPWFEEYLKIFVMYLVSAFIVRTSRQLWALFVMTAVVLGYISYEVNYVYFVNHYLGIYRNGYGGLDNNGAGLMLAMGVPLCWFCFEGTGRWWRWGYLLLIPVIVHAVLMTYSRGAMVALLAACPMMVLLSRHRVQLALALLVFALALIPVMAGPEISARFLTIQDYEIDETAQQRRQSWAAAWEMAKDNPILGVGVRNANLFSHNYGADMEGRTIHSQYLQIAADNGIVGLALYLFMLATAWFTQRRRRRSMVNRADAAGRQVRAIASGIECSMVVYCVGALFLSLEVFELPYLLLFIAAQLGVVTVPAPAPPAESAAEQEHEQEARELAVVQ